MYRVIASINLGHPKSSPRFGNTWCTGGSAAVFGSKIPCRSLVAELQACRGGSQLQTFIFGLHYACSIIVPFARRHGIEEAAIQASMRGWCGGGAGCGTGIGIGDASSTVGGTVGIRTRPGLASPCRGLCALFDWARLGELGDGIRRDCGSADCRSSIRCRWWCR